VSKNRSTFVRSPAVTMPRGKPRGRLLIIGPRSWEIDDLHGLKDMLEGRYASVTTLRDSGELTISDVEHALPGKTALILVLGEDEQSWCNRNRNRVVSAARRSGIEATVVPTMHIEAVVAIYA
jgi:hypothetical protein